MLTFLLSLGLSVEQSNRNILGRKELDFYLPEEKIGIEFNGLYWHSEAAGRSKNYHRNKWAMCRNKDVQLIQIWEDDWRDRKALVSKTLTVTLGKANQLSKVCSEILPAVDAQHLRVVPLPPSHARTFLDTNHLDGYAHGTHYLGLEDSSTLRAVLVLQEETPGGMRIVRYAAAGEVSEGFAVLLKASEIRYSPSSFIGYTDNCMSDEVLYQRNGFIPVGEIEPDYVYLASSRRHEKSHYTRQRFHDDPNLKWVEGATEDELAKLNGIHKIWDAGKTIWTKSLNL